MLPNDTPEVAASDKQCGQCKQVKPLREFHRKKSSRDGRNATCKQCRAEREGFKYRPPAQDGFRRCSRCKIEFPANLEYFYEDRRYPGALAASCKSCAKDSSTEWARDNREVSHQRKRKWAKNNPDKTKDSHVRSYAKDIQRSRAKGREYRRAWYRDNPAAARAANDRRRALKRNATGSYNNIDIDRQYKAQRGKCYYCGANVGKKYHIDHVVPLSRGGSNGPENLVIACPKCNQSKSDKLPHEWPQGNRLL